MSIREPDNSATLAPYFASGRRRILWVKSGSLFPANTGGRIRTWQMLRAILKKHDVTYLALGGTDGAPPEGQGGTDLRQIFIPWQDAPRKSPGFFAGVAGNLLGSTLPYVLWKYRSRGLEDQIRRFDESGEFDLMVCDFLTPALNFPIKELRTPAVVFQHNIEALIWERMAASASNPLSRAYLKLQHSRMEKWEERYMRAFKGVITVSPDDSKLARERYGIPNVLGDVPTGVDPDYFAEVREAHRATNSPVLGFLGSMDWLPNIDGIRWFLTSMWPQLKERCPELRFLIIGRNPPDELRRLAQGDAAVTFTGTVDDVRPSLAQCDAMVVPLRVGGGTRLKILEMMAAGLPMVSTTVGAEGLPLSPDRHLLIADTESHFVNQTERLMKDSTLRTEIAENAWSEIVTRSSWEWCSDVFLNHCAAVIQRK